MRYILIFCFTILSTLHAVPSVAESDGIKYCEYNVGDSIPVFTKATKNTIQALLFVDANSCSICEHAFIRLIQDIRRVYTVECNVFIGGADNVSGFKEFIEAGMQVNEDPVGAYRKLYRVIKYPCYILTTSDGRIVCVDKAGSGKSDINTIMSCIYKTLSSTKSNSEQLNKNGLILRKTVSLSMEKSIPLNSRYYTAYNKENGRVAVVYTKSGKVFVYDSTLSLEKTFDIPTLTKNSFSQCFKPRWIGNDSLLILYDNFHTYRVFSVLDIKNSKLTPVHFNAMKLYNNDSIGLHYEYLISKESNKVIIPLHQANNHKNTGKTLMLYNLIDTSYKIYGVLDSIYYKAKMSDLSYSVLETMDNGYTMEKQNLSDKVNIYTPDGELSCSIALNFDASVWRYYCEDFPYNGTNDKIISAYNKRSFVDKIFNCGNNTYCIGYINYTFDSSHQDLSQYKAAYYLHFFDGNGKSQFNIDFAVPGDKSVPFFVDHNSIGVTCVEGNEFQVKWYGIDMSKMTLHATMK